MKKLISLLLTVAFILGLVPVSFGAAGQEVAKNVAPYEAATGVRSAGFAEPTEQEGRLESSDDPVWDKGTTKDFPYLYGFEEGGLVNYERKWIRFSANDPRNVDGLVETADENEVFAAEYFDGVIYAVKEMAADENFYFGTIDPETYEWTQISSAALMTDMAYDYSTQTMYGIVFQGVRRNSMLVKIDLVNGNFTNVGEIQLSGEAVGDAVGDEGTPLGLAISTQGTIYVVEIYTGKFYSINKDDASATFIGETGENPDTIQSMTFDHETQTLYWASYNGMKGELYAIDTNTGRARSIGRIDGSYGAELTGLHTRPNSNVLTVPEINPVVGVEMNAENCKIVVGTSFNADTAVLPLDSYVDRSITYTSSDPQYVTVSPSGLITAVAIGTATITVSTVGGSYTDSCTVTVIPENEASTYLSEAANAPGSDLHFFTPDLGGGSYDFYPWVTTMDQGRYCVMNTNTFVTQTPSYICAEVTAVGGSTLSYDWRCDTSYAPYGDYYTIYVCDADSFYAAPLSTFIEAWAIMGPRPWFHDNDIVFENTGRYVIVWEYINGTDSSQYGTMFGKTCHTWLDNVMVEQPETNPIESFEISPNEIYLYVGDEFSPTVTITPSDAPYHATIWSSDDESIATVNSAGMITAVSEGMVRINAELEGTNFVSSIFVTVGPRQEPIDYTEMEALVITPGTHRMVLSKGTSDNIYIPGESGITAYGKLWMVELAAGEGFDIETTSIAGSSYFFTDIFVDDLDSAAVNEMTFGPSIHHYLAEEDCTVYILISGDNSGQQEWITRIIDITYTSYAMTHPESVSFNTDSYDITLNRPAAAPDYTVLPANADNQNVTFRSLDENVFVVGEETGLIIGKSIGTGTLEITTVDGGLTDTVQINVGEAGALPEYDGNLYGSLGVDFAWESFSRGFAIINKDDPSQLEQVFSVDSEAFFGTYANGLIYAYYAEEDPNDSENAIATFVTIDPMTWTFNSSIVMPNQSSLYFGGCDMAYDYTTETMFCVYFGGGSYLAEVDLLTGEPINIRETSSNILAITAGPDGTLYGVTSDGSFVTLDKETGAATTVASLGMNLWFACQSSMTYDYEEGYIYLSAHLDDFTNKLLKIDPLTGAVLSEGPLGSGSHSIPCLFTLSMPEKNYELGDVNLDGSVNTGDVAAILRHLVGLQQLTAEGLSLGDINDDGTCNSGDAAALLGYLLEA